MIGTILGDSAGASRNATSLAKKQGFGREECVIKIIRRLCERELSCQERSASDARKHFRPGKISTGNIRIILGAKT